MLNNYLTVINAIDTFCVNHANIHRFKSSFFEQMDDFSTSGNSFPIFYSVPNDIAMEENIDVMSFRIYCLDILQKDRVNEEAILNSTYQNLRDLVNWLRNDEYNDLNVLNSPRAIPVNNFLVDFTTGWYIDVELEVSVGTNDCAIPFTQNFQLTGTSCDVSYITPFLTCATVTGCTTLQEYVAQQINANSGASANYYTTGATLVGSTAFFDRNDLLSAYTLDLSSLSQTFSGTTNYYSKFNSGGTIQDGIIYDNSAAGVFIAPSGNNASLNIVSPAGFYYPALGFYNTGSNYLGGISAYANSLYIGGAGASITPLLVNNVVQLPYLAATANTLTYVNSANTLLGVTLGSGLNLSTGGTLSVINKFSYTDASNGITSVSNSNTLSKSVLIPANTLTKGSLNIKGRSHKSGTGSFAWLIIYVNTTNSLSGASEIGRINNASNNTVLRFSIDRTIPIQVGSFFSLIINAITGYEETITNNVSTVTIDWTVDQYIILAVQANGGASPGESLVANFLSVNQF